MQITPRSPFTTVKTEGAILPADLLQRVHEGTLDGMRPEDYHLAPNERLGDAISRSWNRLRGVWQSFDSARRALDEAQSGTSLTRERWLLILFDELGYGRLPYRGGLPLDPADDDSPRYPISHEYEGVPIHLVSFRQSLDRTDAERADTERAERYRRSPHSLLQEFLNRTDTALWGFVSNGLALRVLRDNVSLTRAAFLEFDLEAMMTGELFADFSLLWLVAHQSRVERQVIARPKKQAKAAGKKVVAEEETEEEDGQEAPLSRTLSAADCWLEYWSGESAERGTRALDSLRDGVQEAIERLGRGFLAHPANEILRDRLRVGTLDKDSYYRQLLRQVYRLIFLLVAEDRDLLLMPDADAEARRRYINFYSVGRLRALAAARRGGAHPDLYRGLRLVFAQLRDGYPPLGLPALGGFLFSERATPDLDEAELANEDLLEAVRALAFTVEGRVLRPVDYRNLGAEELGSVYESLLELHPELNVTAATFSLRSAAGSERKTTGSYYTPTSLITSLLDSALEPVVAARLKGKKGAEAEAALLDIKVVDPAAGSGHFLIAAANRLAGHLARVRTGDSEPSPADRRDALRDVVGRCLYGVDLNEMAVELCKVSLWLETLDPGRPLSFLDHHIRHGNSLIGATPALLAGGIPDTAFTPITGDDKRYVAEWKKRNKQEREGQAELPLGTAPWERLGDLAAAMAELEDAPDDTPAEVRAKEQAWEALVRSGAYENNRLLADAWCAAFVFPKHYGIDFPISDNDFRDIERNPHSVPRWLKEEIVRLRDRYRFFHWHLAYPEVFRPAPDLTGQRTGVRSDLSGLEATSASPTGWTGGFDVVLGNPPWERIKLQEKEWFAQRDPAIATAPNAAARGRLITALQQENPALYEAFLDDRRAAEGESHFVRNSGRYPLCGRGDVNTYTIFAELARHLTGPDGRAGIIVPSGIAIDDTTKFYFQDIIKTRALVSLFSFENEEFVFPAVHHATKFCLLTLSGHDWVTIEPDFVFFVRQTTQLRGEGRHFTLSAADIALLNPNTHTCPIFRSRRDAELTKAIYRRVPVLIREADPASGRPAANPWGISFLRMFDMSNDSHLFRTRAELEGAGFRLVGNQFKGVTSDERRAIGEDIYIPLYEGKMLHHFDYRFGTYEGQTQAQANQSKLPELTPQQHADPTLFTLPRYWVEMRKVEEKLEQGQPWLLGFRDITSTTNVRTAIASVFPRAASSGINLAFSIESITPALIVGLVGTVSSYAFDFAVRQKVGGSHLSQNYLKQLAVLPPETFKKPCPWENFEFQTTNDEAGITSEESAANYHIRHKLIQWLLPRVVELTYTAYDLRPFAADCGYQGPPFRWDEERRFLIRCELDAAYFHLYGIERDDAAYIMDTFPIVRRKDEADYGEYRTKRVILEIYDELRVASDELRVQSGDTERSSANAYEIRDTGEGGYRTRLDPPPGDPRAAHPWDEEWLGPERPVEEWWQEVPSDKRRVTSSDTERSSANAYGIRDTTEVTSDEFRVTAPVVRRDDETRETRYEIRDTGKGGYRTRLEPPPGDPGPDAYAALLADHSPWALMAAEEHCLFACALRFDGYRYSKETGFDLRAALAALLEREVMPESGAQRQALFFFLQRGLGKWGLERATPDSRYWGAFRQLFLLTYDRDPGAYANDEYAGQWAARYADQAAAWAALVGHIHAATVYVDDAVGFDPTERDTLIAYRIVLDEYHRRFSRPAPSLELRPPPVKTGKRGASKPAPQSPLPIPYAPFPAPSGPRSVRLRRAMALGKDASAAATAELVAFLADEDGNIRWLAGSSLAQREDAAGVVGAIAVFIRGAEPARVAAAREEMARVLTLIAETAGEERVRAMAGEVMRELPA